MPNLVKRLLAALATSTAGDLRRQVQFLRAENQILRSRLKHRIRTTPRERAHLVRLGRPLGSALQSVISIVSPQTFVRWVNRLDRPAGRRRWGRGRGRPRTPKDTRELILRLARETDWGYTRIQGELMKLRVRISRTAIMNILKEEGIPRAPQHAETTWDQFMRAHAETLWGCDFVAQRVLTRKGFVTAFLMVFLHLKTRQVYVTNATLAPSDAWVAKEAEAVIAAARAAGHTPGMVLRDRDSKFGGGFIRAMRGAGVRSVVLPKQSPHRPRRAARHRQPPRRRVISKWSASNGWAGSSGTTFGGRHDSRQSRSRPSQKGEMASCRTRHGLRWHCAIRWNVHRVTPPHGCETVLALDNGVRAPRNVNPRRTATADVARRAGSRTRDWSRRNRRLARTYGLSLGCEMMPDLRHDTHDALELEFYVPAPAWDHPATQEFLASVYSLVEGATVVGGAKGVWRGIVESTHLVRIVVRKTDVRFDLALAAVRGAVKTLMEEWATSPGQRQDSFIFTVRELTLYDTRLTDADGPTLPTSEPRAPKASPAS